MNFNDQAQTYLFTYHKCNRFALRLILLASALAFTANTYAHGSLDIVSGTAWDASTSNANDINGISWLLPNYIENGSWIPAFAPYPNPVTAPNPNLNGDIHQPDPGTTNAQLMWYYGGTGTPTGTTNSNEPDTAYFRYTFDFASKNLVTGGPYQVWVAADDWMTLYVNGTKVTHDAAPDAHGIGGATYILDLNLNSTGQPNALLVNIDTLLNKNGENVFAIEAHNGYFPTPGSRSLQYVFFDAQFLASGAAPLFINSIPIPEPASLALLVAGFGAMVAIRRRSLGSVV